MKIRRLPTAAACGLTSLAVQACAPAVQLAAPPGVVSAKWRGHDGGAGQPASAGNLGVALNSPELARLTSQALAANADIGAARARIIQARAQLSVARAAMLPVATGSGGLNLTKTDNRGGSAFDFSDAFAGIDVSWDADLFGRGRATRRAALNRVAAATFDRDAVALAVEAEVARAFVQHAVLAQRVALLDRNLANARELDRILNIRLREGVGTKVETGLQAIEVRQLEAERLRLLEAQSQTRNALAVLVGIEAPLFEAPRGGLASLSPPSLSPVQPAELLVRRPDLQAAEARIRAASGDVEAARAAFLPNLTLSASALGQAASLTGPYGATLTAGAALLGRSSIAAGLQGELCQASGVQAETVELYRGTLLTALPKLRMR
jgi:outer membrane protein TolC